MANKLTLEQKVEISLTRGKSLRELAREYGVHHSCIAEIQEKSEELITRYWREKANQVGRPANNILPEQAEIGDLKKKIGTLENNLALKDMRVDWLELKLKWDDELFAEAKIKKKVQLKKNKK